MNGGRQMTTGRWFWAAAVAVGVLVCLIGSLPVAAGGGTGAAKGAAGAAKKKEDREAAKPRRLAKPAAAKAKAGAEGKAAKPAPTTYTVKKAPFRIEVKLAGVFEAGRAEEISLRTKAWPSLRVVKAVAEGAAVKKGDQLLWLETEKIDRAIVAKETSDRLGELALKQAVEELRMLEKSTPEQLASLIRSQKRAEDDWQRNLKIDRPLAIKNAESTLKYRKDVLEYTREELRQLKKMYEADDLTEATEEIVLKRQQNAVQRAELSAETAQAARDRTIEIDMPRRLEDGKRSQKRRAESTKSQQLLVPLALEKKRLEVVQAKRSRERAIESLADMRADRKAMTVRSPTDGVVYYGRCVRGQWTTAKTVRPKLAPRGSVASEEVFMTIVDPSSAAVRATVPEKELHLLRPGLPGEATPTGYPDRKLKVKLERFSTVLLAPGQFDARLRVEGDPRPIMPGMTCSVRLVAYESKSQISVPSSAVHKGSGKRARPHVYVKKGDGHVKRTVRPGRSHAGRTEIRKGLSPGDVVLLKKPA